MVNNFRRSVNLNVGLRAKREGAEAPSDECARLVQGKVFPNAPGFLDESLLFPSSEFVPPGEGPT
jgi:hypothetical protein